VYQTEPIPSALYLIFTYEAKKVEFFVSTNIAKHRFNASFSGKKSNGGAKAIYFVLI
jgi:hypothetical protein